MKKNIITYITLFLLPPVGWIRLARDTEFTWGKKAALGSLSALWTICAGLMIASPHFAAVDQNGWKHYESSESLEDIIQGSNKEDSNAPEKTYAVISTDKEKLSEMNAHDFIETIRKGMKAAEGRKWIVFMFDDGTGLMFPEVDVSEPAFYGTINSSGTMDEIYGVVTITGTTVSYEDSEEVATDPGYDYIQCIPQEYINDSTYIHFEDGVMKIQLVMDGDIYSAAADVLDKIHQTDLLNEIENVSLSINGTEFSWTKENGITVQESVQETTEEATEQAEQEEED